MPSSLSRGYGWLVVAASIVTAVVVCAAYLDRPVAAFAHRAFYGTPAFDVARAAFSALHAALIVLVVALLACSAAAISGRVPAGWARLLFRGSAAAVGALLVTLLLKFVVGRSQVYPDFLAKGLYEFRPFGGGGGLGAFPSATLSVTTALFTALRAQSRRWRAVYGAVSLLIALSMILINGHWLSDVVGGAYVGAVVGALINRRGESAPRRT